MLYLTKIGKDSFCRSLIGDNPELHKIKYFVFGSDNGAGSEEDTSLHNEIFRVECALEVRDDGTLLISGVIPAFSDIDGQEIGEYGLANERGLIFRETLNPKEIKVAGKGITFEIVFPIALIAV